MRTSFSFANQGNFITVIGVLGPRKMSITTSKRFCGEWTRDLMRQLEGTCDIHFGSVDGMKRELSKRLRASCWDDIMSHYIGSCTKNGSYGCDGCKYEATCDSLFNQQ